MSDSDDGDYGGSGGYSSEESYGDGEYSSEEYCGGGAYSSEENYGDAGYSSEENHGGGGGYSSEENCGDGGYSSEENHGGGGGGGGCSSEENYGDGGYSSEENHGGGYYSEENYGSGGGCSSEYIDPDEEYCGGGQTETDPDGEDSCGYDIVNPNLGSYGSENTSKFQYNDYEDGKNYSGKFTSAYKTQDFVEKRTGNPGFKEETTYKSYYKVDDNIGGSKTECGTQVKTTKKVTATKSSNVMRNSSSYTAPAITSSFKRLNTK